MEENKEENKEEKVEVNKKTRITKKKQENSRVSDILQKIEVKEKKETTKKVKNITEKKTTKSEDKEETKNKSANKKVDKKEKEVKEKEKEVKSKKIKIEENEELKKIEEEIKKQKKLPKEISEKVNKKIYRNILIAITMVIYLIFINLGYININQIAFITDLQVFSIALIVTTIIIFEKAYKKDSGKLTITAIEVLSLAILTMFLPRIYNQYNNIFVEIVGIASIAYVVYYFVKCIIIYAKTRKKIRKSDVKKISKK